MELSEIKKRLVRYGELKPCKTAFIDAHTPGSNQKENFTIIGSGVSESADQHVHINIPHGKSPLYKLHYLLAHQIYLFHYVYPSNSIGWLLLEINIHPLCQYGAL